jgi:hypothetical protein
MAESAPVVVAIDETGVVHVIKVGSESLVLREISGAIDVSAVNRHGETAVLQCLSGVMHIDTATGAVLHHAPDGICGGLRRNGAFVWVTTKGIRCTEFKTMEYAIQDAGSVREITSGGDGELYLHEAVDDKTQITRFDPGKPRLLCSLSRLQYQLYTRMCNGATLTVKRYVDSEYYHVCDSTANHDDEIISVAKPGFGTDSFVVTSKSSENNINIVEQKSWTLVAI